MSRRAHRRSAQVRIRATRPGRNALVAVGVAGAVATLLVSCTEVDVETDAPFVVEDSSPPTTVLDVGYLEVAGYEFCAVIDMVAPEIQVYADPASNFGSAGDTRDAYVGALRAFDAIEQVAPDVIKPDARLLRQTLDDAVTAALAADWDVTAIKDAAARGVDAQRVADALLKVRTYAREQCAVDIVDGDSPPTSAPGETDEQRIRRILEYLFPDLDDRKLDCLEPRLPLDFDPQSASFDPAILERAFASCRIDVNDPGAPTSVPPAPFSGPRPTTPLTGAAPVDTSPETDGS